MNVINIRYGYRHPEQYAPTTFDLKTDRVIFDAVRLGYKRYEIRKNDRDPKFQIGDYLNLIEIDKEKQPTGNTLTVGPVHSILGGGQYGIEEEYVILAW